MDVVRLASELVAIDSSDGELEVARYIRSYLKGIGIRSQVIEFQRGRANVVAAIGGRSGGLMLNGHIDTVPAGDAASWRYGPGPVLKGNRLYGRGASDMKGGIAAILSAVGDLDVESISRKLLLAFVADEERVFAGSLFLLRYKRDIFRGIDYGIIAEPTGMKLQVAQKGVVAMRLRFKGRSAHGSLPWLGDNAILKAARFVNEFDRLSSIICKTDSILGKGTVNIGTINGGTVENVVPAYCDVEIDRRIVPGETTAAAVLQVRSLLKRMGLSPDIKVKVARDPFKLSGNERVVGVMRSISGTGLAASTGYTEAELYYREAGIRCIVYGPGNKNTIHTSREYVNVANLKRAARVIREAACRLCR